MLRTHFESLRLKGGALLVAALVGSAMLATSAAAATSVSGLSVAMSAPTAAAGGTTVYSVGFTTSASGTLRGSHGGTVTIVFPGDSSFAALGDSPLSQGTNRIGSCGALSGTSVLCSLDPGQTLAAGQSASATLNGVTNPTTAGTYRLKVKTSADRTLATSPPYTVTAPGAVSGLTVDMGSPTTSARGLTTYVVGLTTSATGALAGDAQSSVTIQFPTGTTFTAITDSPLSDGTDEVGQCFFSTDTTVVCPLDPGAALAANHVAIATIHGVNNPAKAGSYQLTLNTSSDVDSVTAPSYAVSSQTGVSASKLALTSSHTGDPNVTYTVTFHATSGMDQPTGSVVSLTFGRRTGLLSTEGTLLDGVTPVADCAYNAGTTVLCFMRDQAVVHAGDALSVALDNVKNPPTTSTETLKIATTSDTKVKSVPYCIAATGVPCISGFTPASGAVGATVKVAGVNLGGASQVAFDGVAAAIDTDTATSITTAVPDGATDGSITVTTGGGSATSAKSFTVLP